MTNVSDPAGDEPYRNDAPSGVRGMPKSEITSDMIRAGRDAFDDRDNQCSIDGIVSAVYRAMEGARAQPAPGSDALEVAIDFLWPHYTDSRMPKMVYAAKDAQCLKLARILERHATERARQVREAAALLASTEMDKAADREYRDLAQGFSDLEDAIRSLPIDTPVNTEEPTDSKEPPHESELAVTRHHRQTHRRPSISVREI